jgi:hypothetical protein
MIRAISAAGLAFVLGAGNSDPEPKRCTVVSSVAALDRPEGKRVVFEISSHTGVLLLKQSGKQNKWCEVWGGALGSGWVPCERTRLDNPDVSFVLDGKVAASDKPSGRTTDLVFEKGQGGFLVKYSGAWCRLSAAAAGEGWVPCARGHIEGIKAPAGESAKVARARTSGRGR